MNAFSLIGNFASIVSLLMTIWVLRDVRRLRRHFSFQGRFPALRKALNKHTAEISSALNSTSLSPTDTDITLRKCRSTLNSLATHAGGSTRRLAQKLSDTIGTAISETKTSDRNTIQSFYFELITLESDLDHMQEDQKWQPPR